MGETQIIDEKFLLYTYKCGPAKKQPLYANKCPLLDKVLPLIILAHTVTIFVLNNDILRAKIRNSWSRMNPKVPKKNQCHRN
jgi:hypothetical protein